MKTLSILVIGIALLGVGPASAASDRERECTLQSESQPNRACLAFVRKRETAPQDDARRELAQELGDTWRELRRGRFGTGDFPARRLAALVARQRAGSDAQRGAVAFYREDLDAVFAVVQGFFGPKWKEETGGLSEVEERRHQAGRGLPQLVAAVDKFGTLCGVNATIKDWRDGSLLLDKHAPAKVASKQVASFVRPDGGEKVTVYCSGRVDVKIKSGGGYVSQPELHTDAKRISGCISACRSSKQTAACARSDGDPFSDSEYACTLSCRAQCR